MAIRMKDIPNRYEFKKLYPEGREWLNTGNSCIIDPSGEFIAGPVEMKEEILYAKIDLNEIIKAKRMFDAAGHYSRPDDFEFKVNKNE
jgi:nitrilase